MKENTEKGIKFAKFMTFTHKANALYRSTRIITSPNIFVIHILITYGVMSRNCLGLIKNKVRKWKQN